MYKKMRKIGVVKRMQQVRRNVFLILLLLAMMTIVPMASADEKIITLNITFPKEESVIYGDVIGSPIYIYTEIESPNGIKEVWITNGINQSSCRAENGHKFFCQNPWKEGRNTIKITAYDNSGNVVSQMRNYSLFIGQQPPPTMTTSHQNTSTPGFGLLVCICSILFTC